MLKRRLNYNLVQKYEFIVTAQVSKYWHTTSTHTDLFRATTTWRPDRSACFSLQDNGGLNDSATVVIEVQDYDNLNPYFSHNVYQAFIPENQVSLFS